MPVPANTPALFLGRPVFDKRKFRPDTDPAVIDCLSLIAQTLMGAGWPSPAKTGDADIKMAVYAEDDGMGAHLLWGGNPADPLSPTPIVVSASGSATVIWQEEGSTVISSGTANFVGSGVTVTDEGDGKATITITGGGGGGSTNAFGTIQVSGQSDVVADAAPDTATFIAGLGIDITTNAGSDSVTWAFRNGDGLESDGESPANIRVKAHTYIDVTSDGVAVDLTEVSGFSGAGDQYLRNNSGAFLWDTLPALSPTAGTYIDVSGSTVSVDLTEVAGYDDTKVQLLGNLTGNFVLAGVDTWLQTLFGYAAGKVLIADGDGLVKWAPVSEMLDMLELRDNTKNQSIGANALGDPEWQEDTDDCP